MKSSSVLSGLLIAAAVPFPVHAGQVNVAVAANFAAPMQRIAAGFEKDSGHKAVLAFGATGKFHAQIGNGAPFDVLLAADASTPIALVKAHLALPDTRFTYAIGRLVLWSSRTGTVDQDGRLLARGEFTRLAIANPKTAPYGAAAIEVLTKLNLLDRLQPRLVQGENIAQAYQFVSTGNAQLGFVALSQVWRDGKLVGGSGWVVPAGLHTPIRQDAVVLVKGAGNPAALALIDYLKSEKVRDIVRSYGYER